MAPRPHHRKRSNPYPLPPARLNPAYPELPCRQSMPSGTLVDIARGESPETCGSGRNIRWLPMRRRPDFIAVGTPITARRYL